MDLDARRSEAYFALAEVNNLLGILMEEQLQRDGGLSYLQFFVLAHLARATEGRMRMTDLADTVLHSRSGLSYQATKLEAEGLIRRAPSPTDERSITAAITDRGRDLVDKVIPGHIALVRRGLFDALDEEQTLAFADSLEVIRDRLRSIVPTSAARRRGAT